MAPVLFAAFDSPMDKRVKWTNEGDGRKLVCTPVEHIAAALSLWLCAEVAACFLLPVTVEGCFQGPSPSLHNGLQHSNPSSMPSSINFTSRDCGERIRVLFFISLGPPVFKKTRVITTVISIFIMIIIRLQASERAEAQTWYELMNGPSAAQIWEPDPLMILYTGRATTFTAPFSPSTLAQQSVHTHVSGCPALHFAVPIRVYNATSRDPKHIVVSYRAPKWGALCTWSGIFIMDTHYSIINGVHKSVETLGTRMP